MADLWDNLLDCLELTETPGGDGSIGFAGKNLLLRQHSPVLAHGRCFGRGDILTADGTLVASYAQEALLRFRESG